MHLNPSSLADDMDFAALLEASFVEEPERGDIVTGTILAVDNQGLIVDIGAMKRDGIVPRKDIERLGLNPSAYQVGNEIEVIIIRSEDDEGNLVLSVSQAQQSEDWKRAEALMNGEELWEGIVSDVNRGGLIVPFGNLRGFVPASHVVDLPRGINEDERKDHMAKLLGRKITVKVIEVNRKRRRLVFSQRDAQRGRREARKELLLDELKEGEVRKGVVSGLRDFGAFVDLGGADGLIHISELAWHRVKHPREVLNVGDEVEVYVLRLDAEGKRIGLSLKRMQKNPWAAAEELYHVGQLVEGTVSRVAQFGAFISLEPGIEALLHASQIAEPPPADPSVMLYEGQKLLLRVISIEPDRQRLGLSLKDVTDEEKQRWQERHVTSETESVEVELPEDDSSINEADSVQLAENQASVV
ncbi:MAG: S1 RNA-binding domain-containing protein [Chloroflexi bacterium]|jgi:small subunit ribosomal protein S1|nr:S1 RNA-binding domain-containing protein [Chloroflexota bacterium]MDL1882700.1 S1 RNA-binding domain-containing protein [Anaerolineae bacterium CFX8]